MKTKTEEKRWPSTRLIRSHVAFCTLSRFWSKIERKRSNFLSFQLVMSYGNLRTKKRSYYTIEGPSCKKFFPGNDPFRKKHAGKRIWHFRSEKTLPWFREGLCIEAKSRKNAIFRLFASIHKPSLNQRSAFCFENVKFGFPHVFTPRSFPEKIFSSECPPPIV